MLTRLEHISRPKPMAHEQTPEQRQWNINEVYDCQIVGRGSKPRNSDFYQNDFLSTREYQTHGAHSVKFS